jgi:SAM-dependent methyltransferase
MTEGGNRLAEDEIDFAEWKTFEHAGWERASNAYDDTLGKVTRQAVEQLLDLARVAAGCHVLDVATGPGYAAAAAGARGAHVIGIDFSERMIERAWWKYPGIEFRTADAENLPFSDSIFDCVTTSFAIGQFPDSAKAISEACRVLVFGGRFALSHWRVNDPTKGFAMIGDAIARYGNTVEMPRGPADDRFSNRRGLVATLSRSGFDTVSTRSVELRWRVEGADEMFEALANGAVRVGALLRGQSRESSHAIRGRLREGLEPYRAKGAFEFPMPAILAVATKRSPHSAAS